MAETIVKKPNGKLISLSSRLSLCTITKASQSISLMGEEVVRMSIESVEPLDISIGDSVELYGRLYRCNTAPQVKRSARMLIYDVVFEGVGYDLLRVIYLDVDTSGVFLNSEYSLTGSLELFLSVLLKNVTRVLGDCWELDSSGYQGKEVKTLSFSSENCLAVLQRLCQEFSVEFDISSNGKTHRINVRKQGAILSDCFEYGRGKGLYELIRKPASNKNFITRLYAYGGTSNLKSGYRNFSQRLKFSDEGFIESPNVKELGVVEGVKVFEDIYPGRVGKITSLSSSITAFIDSSFDFDLNEKAEDGISTKWLIAGSNAKVHFNSGKLAGYEFDISYYNHSSKTFTIIPFTDERGQQFPSPNSEAFRIGVGDEYVLLNIVMPDSYLSQAEMKLRDAANEYLLENCNPRVEYDLKLDPFYLKSRIGEGMTSYFNVGDQVRIVDKSLGVDQQLRLLSFERDILDPYSYELTLGSEAEVTRIERIIADVEKHDQALLRSNLLDPARARRSSRATDELRNMVFDTDGYFIGGKIKPESVETRHLSVGAKSSDILVGGLGISWANSTEVNTIRFNSGVIVSTSIEERVRTWNVNSSSVSLVDNDAYYIFVKCSKEGSAASIVLTKEQRKVDSESGYYWILLGILHSVYQGTRNVSLTYGSTDITGRFIRTGVIQGNGSYFDLDSGEIGGKIVFKSGSKGLYNLDEWSDVNQQINDAKSTASQATLEATSSKDKLAVAIGYDSYSSMFETAVTNGKSLIVGGYLNTEVVDVKALIAQLVIADDMQVKRGEVGNFIVASSLIGKGRNSSGAYNGNRLVLDPDRAEIIVESDGKRGIRIASDALSPLASLKAAGSSYRYSSATNLNTANAIQASKNDVPASGISKTLYLGVKSFAPVLDISLSNVGKWSLLQSGYSVNVPYSLNIVHNGKTSDGRPLRITGSNTIDVTVAIRNSTGVVSSAVERIVASVDSASNGGNFRFSRLARLNFDAPAGDYWIEISYKITGSSYPIRYQGFNHSTLLRSSWWSELYDEDIRYEITIDDGLSIDGAVGITEIGKTGLQSVWSASKYFRVDGDPSNPIFIETQGRWLHNGVEVKFDTSTLTGFVDPSVFATRSYLDGGFYTKSAADAAFLGKSAVAADASKLGGIAAGSYYHSGNFNKQDVNLYANNIIGHVLHLDSMQGYILASLKNSYAEGNRAEIILGTANDFVVRVYNAANTASADFRMNQSGSLKWAGNDIFHGGNANNFGADWMARKLTLADALNSNVSGDAIALLGSGAGSYNRSVIHNSQANGLSIEASLKADSASAEKNPLTLTWRGGFALQGGLKLTNAQAEFSGNLKANKGSQVWDASNLNRGDVDFTAKAIATNGDLTVNGSSIAVRFLSGGANNGAYLAFSNGDTLKIGSINAGASVDALAIKKGDSTVQLIGAIQNQGFTGSGYTASGWQVDNAGNANVKTLTVRELARFYELEINRIRATNGALAVTDSAVVTSISGSTLYFDDIPPFVVGDVVRAQRWNGGARGFIATVSAINATAKTITLGNFTSGDISQIKAGDTIIRWNSSQAGRKGLLYLTASDANSPNLQVIYDNQVKGQFGNVGGLLFNGTAIPANTYAVWIKDGFFTGSVYVTGGNAETIDGSQAKADAAKSAAISAASSDAAAKVATLKSSLGGLAYESLVGLAKLDSTIIQGGYIKTSLLDTNAIVVSSNAVAPNLGNSLKLNIDEYFVVGYNGIGVYANTGAANVSVARVAKDADTPSSSGYMLTCTVKGSAQSPGYGGFYFATLTKANHVFIARVVACFPVGYTMNWASNSIGTGGSSKWLTSNVGTGKYEEYLYKVCAGSTGTFSTTNYFYFTGSPAPTADSPLVVKIASATVYDTTMDDTRMTYISSSGIYTGTITAQQVMASNAVFGSAYIADGAITTAKIANASITSAKIASIDAGSITTGQMYGREVSVGGADKYSPALRLNTSGVIESYVLQPTWFKAMELSQGALNFFPSSGTKGMTLSGGEISFYDSLGVPSIFLRNSDVSLASLQSAAMYNPSGFPVTNKDEQSTSGVISISDLGTYQVSASFDLLGTLVGTMTPPVLGYLAWSTCVVRVDVFLEKVNTNGTITTVGNSFIAAEATKRNSLTCNLSDRKTVKFNVTILESGTYRLKLYVSSDYSIGDPVSLEPSDDGIQDFTITATLTAKATQYGSLEVKKINNGVFLGTNGIVAYNNDGVNEKYFVFDKNNAIPLRIRCNTDIPGILASGSVTVSGGLDSQTCWGALYFKGLLYSERLDVGRYKITHQLGHLKYSAVATTYSRYNNYMTSAIVVDRSLNYIIVEIVNDKNLRDGIPFSFVISGYN